MHRAVPLLLSIVMAFLALGLYMWDSNEKAFAHNTISIPVPPKGDAIEAYIECRLAYADLSSEYLKTRCDGILEEPKLINGIPIHWDEGEFNRIFFHDKEILYKLYCDNFPSIKLIGNGEHINMHVVFGVMPHVCWITASVEGKESPPSNRVVLSPYENEDL